MQNTIFRDNKDAYEDDSGRIKQDSKSTERRLPKASISNRNANETAATTVDPRTEQTLGGSGNTTHSQLDENNNTDRQD